MCILFFCCSEISSPNRIVRTSLSGSADISLKQYFMSGEGLGACAKANLPPQLWETAQPTPGGRHGNKAAHKARKAEAVATRRRAGVELLSRKDLDWKDIRENENAQLLDGGGW